MTPEGEVKKLVKQELDAQGAYHFWPVQTGYGRATLDCIACIPESRFNPLGHPCFWGIECKKEGVYEPTKRQARTMREMRAAGGRTCIVTIENNKLKWIDIVK